MPNVRKTCLLVGGLFGAIALAAACGSTSSGGANVCIPAGGICLSPSSGCSRFVGQEDCASGYLCCNEEGPPDANFDVSFEASPACTIRGAMGTCYPDGTSGCNTHLDQGSCAGGYCCLAEGIDAGDGGMPGDTGSCYATGFATCIGQWEASVPETCDTASQYCYLYASPPPFGPSANFCKPLPAGCCNCDCLGYADSGTCISGVCSVASNGLITLTECP